MRRSLPLVALLALAVSLPALDFGGYLDNVSGVARSPAGITNPVSLIQSTTLALWLEQPLGGFTLDGQASYTFTPAVPLLVDLDRLVIGGSFAAAEAGAVSFAARFGRFGFRDATGYILNHTLDGLSITSGWARSRFELGIGTSALIQKPKSSIILSTLDVLDRGDQSVLFAPIRLFALGSFSMLDVFAGQTVTLGAVVQNDLRPAADLTPVGTEAYSPEAGGQVDTQYVSLGVSGGIGPGLFQRAFYAVNTGRTLTYLPDPESGTGFSYQYALVLAHMAGAQVSLFLPELLNSRVVLSGLFTTGDADAEEYFDGNTADMATAFVPVTPSPISDIFALQPGNSAHLGLSYSLRPLSAAGLDILQTELRGVAYFRTAGSGPVSEASVDPSTSELYIGTDVDMVVTVQPFSDLRFVLAGGAFLPNAAAMSAGNEEIDYQVTLQGVLRF